MVLQISGAVDQSQDVTNSVEPLCQIISTRGLSRGILREHLKCEYLQVINTLKT
jgi:hypothetical protein